jgi:hypothetical protein
MLRGWPSKPNPLFRMAAQATPVWGGSGGHPRLGWLRRPPPSSVGQWVVASFLAGISYFFLFFFFFFCLDFNFFNKTKKKMKKKQIRAKMLNATSLIFNDFGQNG